MSQPGRPQQAVALPGVAPEHLNPIDFKGYNSGPVPPDHDPSLVEIQTGGVGGDRLSRLGTATVVLAFWAASNIFPPVAEAAPQITSTDNTCTISCEQTISGDTQML